MTVLEDASAIREGEGLTEEDEDVRRCVRCVMPETYPEVSLDDEGVCNFCRHYDEHWAPWAASKEEQARSEAELRRIFESAKRKKKRYDALLGISGGKDSSYMLHLCTRVYGLNVMTFTKDGGFLADDAKARIARLVDIFQVPHFYFDDPFARELSGVFMRKTGNFCAPCELSTFNLSAVVAREYDIPLMILGSSSRTEAAPPKDLNPWDPWYFRNVLDGLPYRERLRCSCYGRNYLVREAVARLLGRRRMVVLPNYLEWDEDAIKDLFAREYGIRFGDEHSDCVASPVARHLYTGKLGGNDPRIAKVALLVRSGRLTREAGLEELRTMDSSEPSAEIARFCEAVGMTREEFDRAARRSPAPYLTGIPRLFNRLRKLVRRQAA